MRQTKQRQAIMEVIERSDDHPTAAQVYERVRQRLPGVGYATIYRNLRHLVDQGLVVELRMGEVTQFDRNTQRHDHAVCRRCGRLLDVTVPLPPEVIQAVAEQTGFRLSEHRVELYGLCPDCQ